MANKDRYTKEQIVDALQKSGGFISVAAIGLGCTRKTIYNYFEKYPDLPETITDIREGYLDMAEAVLVKHVKQEDMKAVYYFLDRQGGGRNYTKQQQIDHTSGGDSIGKIVYEIIHTDGEGFEPKGE